MIKDYAQWLASASEQIESVRSHASERLLQKADPDFTRYELLVTAGQRELLVPLLRDPTNPFPSWTSTDTLAKITKDYPFPHAPRRQFPPCVAVGVNFRTSLVSNARVSAYAFNVPTVCRSRPALDERTIRTKGGEFFTQLLEVYFGVFGRANTLNEHFLDHVLPNLQPRGDRTCFCLRFVSRRRPSVSLSPGNNHGAVVLTVSNRLAHMLTNDWALGFDFWQTAWNAFIKLAKPTCRRQLKDSLQNDWIPSAIKAMSVSRVTKPGGGEHRSVLDAIEDARRDAQGEALKYSDPNELIRLLGRLYPGRESSVGCKLERLLMMLQGSLCLAPWAQDSDGNPLMVISIPARHDGKFSCSWTMIPSRPEDSCEDWGIIHDRVYSLFNAAVAPHESLANATTQSESTRPWVNELDQILAPSIRSIASDVSDVPRWTEELGFVFTTKNQGGRKERHLVGLGQGFETLVDNAMKLTGASHESQPCSYCLLYGPAAFLKYVERIVSNEQFSIHAHAARTHDLDRRCEGHYSLFQQERIAGFIDQQHGPVDISRIVMIQTPADFEIRAMSNGGILDDRYKAVRWLTWKVQQDSQRTACALIAGGDGHLRVFINGALLLVWRKRSEPGETHWQLGIEWGHEDSSRNQGDAERGTHGSPVSRLTKEIEQVLDKAAPVRQIVSTIWEISDTPKEGAVFVIGGKAEELPVLCDMVPDDFKMQWARVRDLNGLEQQMLRSLAVMDGAVHLATCKSGDSKGTWVCARRFIAAPHDIGGVKSLSAQTIVDQWIKKKWVGHLKTCTVAANDTEMQKACERLQKWYTDIGAKGTRHRSVLQLCIWIEEHFGNQQVSLHKHPWPLVCSISADGPVKLYQVRLCPCRQSTYLWTDNVI